MDEVKKLLMSGEGNKLTKKTYKVALAEEKRRLLNKLLFMTTLSLAIACMLFLSMYFDIS
jgi:uncharacterized membrane protein YqjE